MGADYNDYAREYGPEGVHAAYESAEPPPPEDRLWPDPLDLREMAQREPEPPQFIVSDWLPAGYATMLAGHGGSGKSYIGLHLAACIASGTPWCGVDVERRRVLILACEDRANVLHWRLSRICAHMGIDMAGLADWLVIHELVGQQTILWHPDPMGRSPLTDAHAELSERMREAEADVLMIDGVADTYAGNENDRAQVKKFVNSLLSLIDEERGAVLLLAHVNKSTASGGTTSEGYSGSTQWHNAVRARWYLYPEIRQNDEDERPQKTGELSLELQKSNLGNADRALTFRWDDQAHLFVGRQPENGFMASIREENERKAIVAAIAHCREQGDYVPAATTGRRTAYHVCEATGKLTDSLRGGKAKTKRFWRRVEELRSNGTIQEGSIRRANRHSVATLELVQPKTEGVRSCAE